MKSLGSISEDEMVAIFLKAEIDSPRWGKRIQEILRGDGKNRTIVNQPNLNDLKENQYRSSLLSKYRGYPNRALFEGFPANVSWERVILDKNDVERCKHINSEDWYKNSGQSGFIRDVAMKIKFGERTSISLDVLQAAQSWDPSKVPEPIIVARNPEDTPVILEGHVRLIAFLLLEVPIEVKAILGCSKAILEWVYY